MSSEPLVSVIVPCFDQARFLGEALASVARQTYARRETVVVDDGSTDDPAAVVAAFPGVRYLPQGNRGTAAARNRRFRDSGGTHVVLLDADDDRLRPPPQAAVADRHYGRLVARNFIWTPGAAMYRRAAVDSFLEYRDHVASQSGDLAYMLRSAVSVRRRHRRHVRRSPTRGAALADGIRTVQADNGERLLDRVAVRARAAAGRLALRAAPTLFRYSPTGLGRRLLGRPR